MRVCVRACMPMAAGYTARRLSVCPSVRLSAVQCVCVCECLISNYITLRCCIALHTCCVCVLLHAYGPALFSSDARNLQFQPPKDTISFAQHPTTSRQS